MQYSVGEYCMTKGQLEAKISEEFSKFEVEFMGRGPTSIRTYINNDMIIVRLKGFMSSSEKKLTETPQGVELYKKLRSSLFEAGRGYLETLIEKIANVAIISTHSDISTKTGEKIIIMIVDKNLEEVLSKGKL